MDTFFWYGELAALGNLDGRFGLVSASLGDVLDSLDNLVALKDFAKDNVLAVEVARKVSMCQLQRQNRCKSLPWGGGGNEELGAVGVLSSVGHGQKTNLGVLQLEVLIRESLAVDCHILAHVPMNVSADPYTYWTFLQFHLPL